MTQAQTAQKIAHAIATDCYLSAKAEQENETTAIKAACVAYTSAFDKAYSCTCDGWSYTRTYEFAENVAIYAVAGTWF